MEFIFLCQNILLITLFIKLEFFYNILKIIEEITENN